MSELFYLDYATSVVSRVLGNKWIIAHRGEWSNLEEQNSQNAFLRALGHDFAIETDIRHHLGKLIISHDIVADSRHVREFEMERDGRYALNIKEDGLVNHFGDLRDQIEESSSFLFDGSIPQMYLIKQLGLPHALRLSEFESEIPWNPTFLWIDGFESNWWLDNPKIISILENFHLIFVSPELHGRSHKPAFDWFADLRVNHQSQFSVCTDFPLELLELCGE